jgi:uncharacterized paraquat-inducible protein A
MIPLQMGVCPKCRKRFLLMEYLPMLIPVVFGIGALLLLSLDAIRNPLVDLSMFAPFGTWIVITLVGIILGKLVTDGFERAWAKEMETDVMRHPVIAEMTDKGWTPITAKSRTKLLFSKSRLARGLGTADGETPEA